MEFLRSLPIGGIYVVIVIFILISFEIGYQLSHRLHAKQKTAEPSALSQMTGGLLAMLAFVLALTFSMVTSQYNFRKEMVLEEANAIGTAYLRADLIDKKYGDEIKILLREYVDTRLKPANERTYDKLINESIQLHTQLWEQVRAAASSPDINTSLMVQAINEVIDMHERRVAAGTRYRISSSIWLTLMAISFLTMATIGVQAGFGNSRRLIAIIPLVMAFAALTTLIVDLNRPQSGMVKIGQDSMISLQKSMSNDIRE